MTSPQSIADIIEKHTIVVLNQTLKHGFTQLPNYILRDKALSFGARLSFAVLLSYAWQEGSCFPGQERMAADLGTHERSVRRYLQELKDNGYVDWKQRGLNQTNVYYILDYHPLTLEKTVGAAQDPDAGPRRAKKPIRLADRTPLSGQERTQASGQERTPVSA